MQPLSRRQFLASIGILSLGGFSLALASDEIDSKLSESGPKSESGSVLIPLIYNPHYNITAFGVEKLHPFDGAKFQKIHDYLVKHDLRAQSDFLSPEALTQDQLLKVHTEKYLKSLHHSSQIAKIMEVAPAAFLPAWMLDWRVLKPMRLASGGTLLTCREALKHGVAINIGGGYHHAQCDKGGGFCVYSDVPIAATILREERLVDRVLIVDTDAHQGNGFAHEAQRQRKTHVLDFFDESIYPFPKVSEDMSVPFPAQTNGQTYLSTLAQMLPEAIARYEPQLIVYNAGSDVLATDPLSTFDITVQQMVDRDVFVISQARQHNIPIAMVLAGGYGIDSANAHALSIQSILSKFDQA